MFWRLKRTAMGVLHQSEDETAGEMILSLSRIDLRFGRFSIENASVLVGRFTFLIDSETSQERETLKGLNYYVDIK